MAVLSHLSTSEGGGLAFHLLRLLLVARDATAHVDGVNEMLSDLHGLHVFLTKLSLSDGWRST